MREDSKKAKSKKYGRPRSDTYGKSIHPKLAGTEEVFELLLSCVRKTGDLSVSRRMVGLSPNDLDYWQNRSPERLEEALLEGDRNRIKTAFDLIETAGKVAMILQDPDKMLSVARIIAPELAVYPVEAERARARQEFSSPAVALNFTETMGGLSQKLQERLKKDAIPEDPLPLPSSNT